MRTSYGRHCESESCRSGGFCDYEQFSRSGSYFFKNGLACHWIWVRYSHHEYVYGNYRDVIVAAEYDAGKNGELVQVRDLTKPMD
jgi:hypothetical protein